MNPHVHLGGISTVITGLEVLLFIGVVHVLARRYEGHPLADAILNIWA